MIFTSKALKIDEENVEGLVARGALYANKGNLERAIEDFEIALKINAEHKNARKYMCETLFAFGKYVLFHLDFSGLIFSFSFSDLGNKKKTIKKSLRWQLMSEF